MYIISNKITDIVTNFPSSSHLAAKLCKAMPDDAEYPHVVVAW
jgi:hypothetical protein